jgi:protein-tyrosine phosphatase
VASGLRQGDWIAVHCAAGIGRTGLFAALVLMALGVRMDRARETVREGGSFAETQPQLDLLDWAAKKLAERR